MPSLPQPVLQRKLRAALPPGTVFVDEATTRPADVAIPAIGETRIYLWTVTTVESDDRDPDEYKIQLILPGQQRGDRGQLELADKPTFLLGYSPDFGVFVGWEARLHEEFAYSAPVYVREPLLEQARRVGWAIAPPRRVREGLEVRVAFSPANLVHYLRLSIQADQAGYSAEAREAYFLFKAPNSPEIVMPAAGEDLLRAIKRVRRDRVVRQWTRDSRFGPRVKKEYGFACAVCGTQLDIVEGAHIIPVSVDGSEDEIWNGIALCPNHHKLFDALAFTVTPALGIQVDAAAIDYLREAHRGAGVDQMLAPFHNGHLAEPAFFENDHMAQEQMINMLRRRASFIGME